MSDNHSDRKDESRRSKVSTAVLNQIDSANEGVGIQEVPTVKVDIETERGQREEAVEHTERLGIEVDYHFVRQIVAHIPANRKVVGRLAESEAIRRIDVYHEPQGMLEVSEGVEATNTDLLHDIGVTGSDATIAVIDTKFNLENDKYEDQVVGTIGGNNLYNEDDDDFKEGFHGTVTAEVVADMAPDADLILASASDKGFGPILDDLEDHDNKPWDFVDVATMSLDFGAGRRIDGLDSLSVRADEFTDDRIFVTAAGNEGSGNHWDGPFRDNSGNDLMEFDEDGTERFAVEKSWDDDEEDPEDVSGFVHVHWDEDWDDDDEEYEVRLYDEETGGDLLVTERTKNPYEGIKVEEGTPATVYIEIENIDASGDEHFDIITSHNGPLSFPVSTPDRSIIPPATSRDEDTIAVSAVDESSENLAGYSSRGPTQDGRQGIDLAAPTHVTVEEGFHSGTSAAAPHVGGGAGIFFGLDGVDPDASEIRDALYEAGRGIADPDVADPNNPDIGFGYLQTRTARDILEGLMIQLDEKWTYDTGSRSQFLTPAVDDTEVYAGGLGEDFFALARDSGAEDWVKSRDGALSDSSAYLSDRTLYVGSGGGVLYAIDEADGSVDWTYTTDSAITSSPVVDSGTVYAGANDGTVHAVDASSGSQEWTADIGVAVYSDVAAASGTVFVTTGNGWVVALDAGSGSKKWQYDTGTELGSSSPTASGTTLYVAADDMIALNFDGSENWTQTWGGTAGSSPTVDTGNGVVYVGSADGRLYAFDANSGTTQWDTEIGFTIASSPALAEERVIVASFEGDVELVDSFVRPGDTIDTQSLSNQTRSSPAVADNEVYIGSEGGLIVAMKGD